MKQTTLTKDDARLSRSIASIYTKIDALYQHQRQLRAERLAQKEIEFENFCITNNLIYSPLNS